MTAASTMPAPSGAGVPAGLNPAQTRAFERLEAARAARAGLEPLDPEWIAAEHYYEQHKEDA